MRLPVARLAALAALTGCATAPRPLPAARPPAAVEAAREAASAPSDDRDDLTAGASEDAREDDARDDTRGDPGDDPELPGDPSDPQVAASVDQVIGIHAIEQTVYFAHASTALPPGAAAALDRVARELERRPEVRGVALVGRSDGTAVERRDELLSLVRAQVVAAALVARGVAPARLVAIGLRDRCPTAGDEGWTNPHAVRVVVMETAGGARRSAGVCEAARGLVPAALRRR